ncbi:M23 family metallopeptidase [Roseibium sp. HPY-6]|uniref:M23 family metallopeptidase n=1 Tax=Roseibium sp. HPY-6 TaxID=3229852 RepID=UPI003390558D
MLRRFCLVLAGGAVVLGADLMWAKPSSAADLELGLPIVCKLGEDCFVQNYVDIDPGNEVQTATCFRAGYDGHKGTDFRVLDTGETADVVASAPGIVRGVRDEMPDRLVVSEQDRQRVADKECGNGVVIAHAGGWETQYCHLRQGSVAVAGGDRVERGQKLGEVGFSGFAAFPHVHLSVRKDGKTVDPFLGSSDQAGPRLARCNEGTSEALSYDRPLWQGEIEPILADAEGTIIQSGFADGPVKSLDLEQGLVSQPDSRSAALVFFARLINLQEGDRVALKVDGPEGTLAESEGKPLDRQKAQWVSFAGRKLRSSAWPDGDYTGTVSLVRNGEIIRQKTSRFTIGG